MLRGFRLVSASRCYLSTGVSMLLRGSVRETSHDEINMEISSYQTEDGKLQMKKNKQEFPQRSSSRTRFQKPPRSRSVEEMLGWGWFWKANTIDTKRILLELENAQTFFNRQDWDSALDKYINLIQPLSHSPEVNGNLAICALQTDRLYMAYTSAKCAFILHRGRMVYYELAAQAAMKEKRYSKALKTCDEGLAIDSKILEADDSDIEEHKKLKQHCIEKINAGLDERESVADDYPFRQFLQGFISQDALENIAASALQLLLFRSSPPLVPEQELIGQS